MTSLLHLAHAAPFQRDTCERFLCKAQTGISAPSHFGTKCFRSLCWHLSLKQVILALIRIPHVVSPCETHLRVYTCSIRLGGTGGSWWTVLTRVYFGVNEHLVSRDTGQKRNISHGFFTKNEKIYLDLFTKTKNETFFYLFNLSTFSLSNMTRRSRQFPSFPRQLKSLRRRTSVSVTSLNVDLGQQWCRESCQYRSGIPSRLYGGSSARLMRASSVASRRGVQDPPERRQFHRYTNRASIRQRILRSRARSLSYGVDSWSSRLRKEGFAYGSFSVIFWVMISSACILTFVHFNFLVALLEVAGKQTYPEEAERIDQFEFQASVEDLRNSVRQGTRRHCCAFARVFMSQFASMKGTSTGMVVFSCCKKVRCASFFVGSLKITHGGACTERFSFARVCLYVSVTSFCFKFFWFAFLVGCPSCFCGCLHIDLTRSLLAATCRDCSWYVLCKSRSSSNATRSIPRVLGRSCSGSAIAETTAMWTEDNSSFTGNNGTWSIPCCTVGLVQGSVTEFWDRHEPATRFSRFRSRQHFFPIVFWVCHTIVSRHVLRPRSSHRRLWH